jgi:transposase
LVAANERIALTFALSPGQAHDAPEGRKLLTRWQRRRDGVPIVMDRAYEGDETRQLVLQLGFKPVVPPNPNRLYPWTYDRSLYRRRNEIERLFRRRNEIERLFRRPKGFRRIFSRFEKLDTMFTAFIHFTLIIDMTCVNML